MSDDAAKRGLALTFGEMEAILAARWEVATASRSQFQARLRKFQRLGIPKEIQGVRGKAQLFGAGDLAVVALALELTDLGLLPERVLAVLAENEMELLWAARLALYSLRDGAEDLAQYPEFDEDSAIYLFFRPNLLGGLRRRPANAYDPASESFRMVPGKALRGTVELATGVSATSTSVINLSHALWEIIQKYAEILGEECAPLPSEEAELRALSRSFIATDLILWSLNRFLELIERKPEDFTEEEKSAWYERLDIPPAQRAYVESEVNRLSELYEFPLWAARESFKSRVAGHIALGWDSKEEDEEGAADGDS